MVVRRKHTNANIAPAIRKLLAQINAAYPNRKKASDGIWPSAAHTRGNPNSQHEAGNALDVTADLGNGQTVDSIVDSIAKSNDSRLGKVIHDGKVFENGVWRTYRGTNMHRTHMHLEVTEARRRDTRPWVISSVIRYPGKVIRKGQHSAYVAWVQKRLTKHGFPVKADGVFGPKTQTAVKAFQKAKKLGIIQLGIVGPKTWKALAK